MRRKSASCTSSGRSVAASKARKRRRIGMAIILRTTLRRSHCSISHSLPPRGGGLGWGGESNEVRHDNRRVSRDRFARQRSVRDWVGRRQVLVEKLEHAAFVFVVRQVKRLVVLCLFDEP